MHDYLRIARAYLCGTALAVWCFMLFCLLVYAAVGEELARYQGSILGGVLSRKSYMAMFVYFNACLLGVLLRDNIAHPWASVLPHYRQKHLLVATLIALFFLGIPMFSIEFFGTSDIAPTSVAVIFLTCLAAGLWTLHHPLLSGLAVPFLIFVMARSSASPLFSGFLAGTTPVTSAALVFISIISLCTLAWRLFVLNEDMHEYANARVWGDLLRGRGGQTLGGLFNATTMENNLATLPTDQRARFQYQDPLKSPFANLRQVDCLSGYTERSLWQRLQLWRLGTAPTRTCVSLGWQLVISLTAIPILVSAPPLVGIQNPARDAVVIMAVMIMTNPFNTWLLWFMRLHRLGYESLRPRTRQEFIRELGLALLWDLIQCWLGGILFMVIAAAIWAPELLQFKNGILFILGTGVGQLCVFAMMGIWFLKLLNRGMVASLLCAFCPFAAMAIWTTFINGRIGIELNIVIMLALAITGMATIALAYRRWCQADLA